MQKYYSPDKGFIKAPESYWIASTDSSNYPALEKDIRVDVAIVGGGMVGISSAYLLKKAGLKVAIIEADKIACGTSGHTTAKITCQHNLIYDKLISQVGIEEAKQYARSNEEAIKLMAKIIEENKIDCDFQWQNAYVYTQSDSYVKKIKKEVKAAQDLGIKAFYTEEVPLPFPVKAAVGFANQAKFHPRKYLLALAQHVDGDGSYIFENTNAVGIEEEEGQVSVVVANGSKAIASKIIIGSHFPFSNFRGLYMARIYQERSYAIAIKAKSKFPDGMFVSAEKPTRSLRSQVFGDEEIILVVGENQKTGHGDDVNKHYENLIDFASEYFDIEEILYRWSAQDCMTMDNVPYIGNITVDHPNIYLATGFKKWGMTTSTVSAMILRDLIVEGKSPWAGVYNPARIINKAGTWTTIKENLDVAINLISGKLSMGSSDNHIGGGQGKILNLDGVKVGAYKDENGKLHLINTTCTHMGCEVKWNNADRTWDCPCHGSRFSPTGDVIASPAFKPLDKIEID